MEINGRDGTWLVLPSWRMIRAIIHSTAVKTWPAMTYETDGDDLFVYRDAAAHASWGAHGRLEINRDQMIAFTQDPDHDCVAYVCDGPETEAIVKEIGEALEACDLVRR